MSVSYLITQIVLLTDGVINRLQIYDSLQIVFAVWQVSSSRHGFDHFIYNLVLLLLISFSDLKVAVEVVLFSRFNVSHVEIQLVEGKNGHF